MREGIILSRQIWIYTASRGDYKMSFSFFRCKIFHLKGSGAIIFSIQSRKNCPKTSSVSLKWGVQTNKHIHVVVR